MTEDHVPIEWLRDLVRVVLEHQGLPESDAATAAWAIVEADARGQHGHGVARVPMYVRDLSRGVVNPRPRLTSLRATEVSAVVDGDRGIGHVVVMAAVKQAIERAHAAGIGWVGTRRSNHAGAGGVYTRVLADDGLIGLYLAVSGRNFMAPFGGVDPLLGTNPLAIAVPAGEGPHFELDMSPAVVPWGRVHRAVSRGEPLPEGWLVDRRGQPVTDPRRIHEGRLVPIGGAKGTGLAMAVGLLAGVLNDAAFGVDVDEGSPQGGGVGQTVIAVRPDLFRDPAAFGSDVARHLETMRSSTPLSSHLPVRTPGSAAEDRRRRARTNGLPVDRDLLGQLQRLAGREPA